MKAQNGAAAIAACAAVLLVLGLSVSEHGAVHAGARAPSMEAATAQFPPNLYLRQLSAGKHIALEPADSGEAQVFQLAAQMKNFVYLVGDRATGEAVVVDGCWDVAGIAAVARADGMAITRFVATHYHWDHIGGPVPRSGGMVVPGVREWAEQGTPVSMPAWELADAAAKTGTPAARLDPLADGQVVRVGGFALQFMHTPGHSPGSMVVHVKDAAADPADGGKGLALITGDTVFPGSCGRLDLPESQPQLMWDSLSKVAQLDGALPIFPGHGYSGWGSTVAHERLHGLLRPMSKPAFDRMMGISSDL